MNHTSGHDASKANVDVGLMAKPLFSVFLNATAKSTPKSFLIAQKPRYKPLFEGRYPRTASYTRTAGAAIMAWSMSVTASTFEATTATVNLLTAGPISTVSRASGDMLNPDLPGSVV